MPPTLDAGFGRPSAGECEPADPIAVRHRGPCEQRGRLCRHHRLERPAGAETHVLAEVHDEQDRTIALLVEQLGMDAAGARGHPPVDAADVVAGQVDPRFGVLHPAAPEPRHPYPGSTAAVGAMRIQGQAGGALAQSDEMRGGERHPRQPSRFAGCRNGGAGGPNGVRRGPFASAAGRSRRIEPQGSVPGAHGTATLESSASTTWSASMPSASASKLGSTRCRSTSWAIAWTSWGAT